MKGFFQAYISLYRPLISDLNELLSNYGLSYSLWQVLLYVKKNGPSMLVDISNYYNVEKPTITRRVHRLVEMQLVKVVPSKDRREKVIQLTESGEELYQVCRIKITDLEHQAMDGISADVQSALFHTLPKIKENIIKGIKNE